MSGSRARVVWSGVDRLELFSRDAVSPTLLGRLIVLHAAGKRGRVEEIDLGGETFEIARRQARHGAFLLRSDRTVVALHPSARGLHPRIAFELGSRSLAVQSAQRRAGLKVTGNFHVLRHTFCSHLAMRNAPARVIQELAGHTHLSTTMRYMHLAEGQKEQAIRLLDRRTDAAAPKGAVEAGVEAL